MASIKFIFLQGWESGRPLDGEGYSCDISVSIMGSLRCNTLCNVCNICNTTRSVTDHSYNDQIAVPVLDLQHIRIATYDIPHRRGGA